MTSPFLTMSEAAEYLRATPRSVRRWIAAGKLKPGRVGRDIRFRQEELDRFVDGK